MSWETPQELVFQKKMTSLGGGGREKKKESKEGHRQWEGQRCLTLVGASMQRLNCPQSLHGCEPKILPLRLHVEPHPETS